MPNCKGPHCGKPIVYVPVGGKSVPVDINVRVIKVDMDAEGNFTGEDLNRDLNEGPVFGVSHFLTCKDANMFSRGRKPDVPAGERGEVDDGKARAADQGQAS